MSKNFKVGDKIIICKRKRNRGVGEGTVFNKVYTISGVDVDGDAYYVDDAGSHIFPRLLVENYNIAVTKIKESK